MDGGGEFPSWKGAGRPGRTPGPPLAALAALDAAGDAGPRAARRPRRRRTRRRTTPARADPAHLQRAAAPPAPPGHRTRSPTRRSRGRVLLAATTPVPRPT